MPLSSPIFSPSHESGEPHQSRRDRLCEHRWMETRVKKYIKTDGSIPFQRWLDRLDSAATARVLSAIVRIKQGNFSRIKWFAGIGEYVIDWGPGYRIYLAKDGQDLIILFGGGKETSAS
jgi:putative addiction module killer protein